MGLLDDLRNQKEGLQAREAREKERQARLQAAYRDEIHPRMLDVYRYLNELVDHLNYIKPRTVARYPLLPRDQTVDFLQAEYKVTIDNADDIRQIHLRCVCRLPEKVAFTVEGKERILDQTERLDRYKLKYHRKDRKDDDYELVESRFILEGPVNVSVKFEGDVENTAINLYIHNLDQPGTHRHVLKARHVDETFLDKLGKFLLRESDKLMELEISEAEKQAIREKLEQERQQRLAELREAEQRAEEEARRQAREKTLVDPLRRLFRRDRDE